MTTYTAYLTPQLAEFFANDPDLAGNPGWVERLDDAGIILSDAAVDHLRARADEHDGHIDQGTDGPRLWIGGDPYPLTPTTR